MSLKIVDQEHDFGSEEWFIGRQKRMLKKDRKQKVVDKKLVDECRSNKDELVMIRLINQGATNDYCNRFGETALHSACFFGKDSVVEKILEKHRDQIEAK